MGYRLQMSAEIHDWLADLRGSDPPSAMLVGEALTALAEEGDRLEPPLVISLADENGPEALAQALDRRYQAKLKDMQILRRRVADAATLRKDIEQQIAELESLRATPDEKHRRVAGTEEAEVAAPEADELAAAQDLVTELRRLLTGVTKAEQQLTVTSQRENSRSDVFRTRKEVLKATYEAARAEYLLEQEINAPGQGTSDGSQQEGPGAPVTGAAGRLRDITAEIERELRDQPPVGGLIELRPGAPADRDIRILFAVEPPGTALLIAVLEGRDAIQDQYPEAVSLSARVLRRARAGQAPEATAYSFEDPQSFLDEFFAGNAEDVAAGAAALLARNRARTLAEQRIRLGLTQAEVARRMSVRQERVSAIERAEPGATEVRTLAAYVKALGGRLDVTADFGAERVLLR